MEDQQQPSKHIGLIIGGILVLLLLALGAYLFLNRNNASSPVRAVTSLFGKLGSEVAHPIGDIINPGEGLGDDTAQNDTPTEEPLFRQLSTVPIAGATAITRDGKTYVRYIAKENGYTYEVDPKTGISVQLTNTTIPRIAEAYWGNNGESVTLRYLTRDTLDRDTIKTYLAYLSVPKQTSATGTPVLGTLIGDFLPDNISDLSISPDGTKLFYIANAGDGVSGGIVTLATRAKKEVFRSTFGEWLPQLLDNEKVILTTKPSAEVEGFAYLYDPKDHSFSRILRKVTALTTLANDTNTRVLFSENIIGKTTLNAYDRKGYAGDEGAVNETIQLPLSTLPEKCVWSPNRVRIFCGAFTATPRAPIPDEWYQGALSFSDLFWTINTDTSEITFLADPSKEESAKNQTFDVFRPFSGPNDSYFFFTNKNDLTLWSMRIEKEKYLTAQEPKTTIDAPSLTPDEMKDAIGSSPSTSTTRR